MNLLNPGSLFGLLTLAYGLGASVPLINPLWQRQLIGRWQVAPVHLSLAASLVGSLTAIWGAASAMREPTDWETRQVFVIGGDQVPYLPRLTLEVRLDALSAFFMLLIAGFAVVVAIYSFGALRAPTIGHSAPALLRHSTCSSGRHW